MERLSSFQTTAECLDNFAAVLRKKIDSNDLMKVFETECFLKTKSDSLRRHWLVLLSDELYGYKDSGKTSQIVMHSLRGVFIQKLDPIGASGQVVFPIKIHFPGFKSRHLYFKSETD